MFSVAGNPSSKEPDIPRQLGSKFTSFSAYLIIERDKLGGVAQGPVNLSQYLSICKCFLDGLWTLELLVLCLSIACST